MSKDKKPIKQNDKTNDINSLLKEIPFEVCYYLKVIIKSGIFETTDQDLVRLDEFLRKVELCPDRHVLAKVISYNIKNIKRNKWFDENGVEITSKYSYFKKSIITGFIKQEMSDEFIQSLYE